MTNETRAEKAEARVVALEALCKAQHGAVARAERAEAELEKCKTANAGWQESYCKRHNDSIEQREHAERAEADAAAADRCMRDYNRRLISAEAKRDALRKALKQVRGIVPDDYKNTLAMIDAALAP